MSASVDTTSDLDHADPNPETGPSSPRRRLVAGRPGVMPSSRAAIGSLLCMIAALLTFAAFQEAKRPPRTTFAVAVRDLAPGDVLRSGDFEFVALALPTSQRTQAVEDATALENTTVLGPVAKGELIQRGMLVRRATPDRVVSFPIRSAYALAGRLRIGTRVSIYAAADAGAEAVSLVATDVLVTRVDNPGESTDATIVVTVAIPASADESRLVGAAATAKLVIVEEGRDSARPHTPRPVAPLHGELAAGTTTP